MKFTGERFVPDAGLGIELELEHLQRYYSACGLVTGKTVLDAACGTGYGAHILAQSASFVNGIDISQEATLFAKEKFPTRNLHFSQGSIEQLPFLSNSHNVIVSFETIEHVTEEIQHSFINEIKRVLTDDGILLISSPDKYIYSDLPKYNNEYHVKEFHRDEFIKFLQPHFKNVQLYEQFTELSYFLTCEDHHQIKKIHHANQPPQQGKYLVALCSDRTLEKESMIDSFVVDSTNLYKKKLDRIIELQNEVDEKNEVIDQKNTLIYRAYSTVFGKNEEIDRTKKALHKKEQMVTALEHDICLKEKQIRELKNSLDHIKNTKGYKLLQQGYKIKNKLL